MIYYITKYLYMNPYYKMILFILISLLIRSYLDIDSISTSHCMMKTPILNRDSEDSNSSLSTEDLVLIPERRVHFDDTSLIPVEEEATAIYKNRCRRYHADIVHYKHKCAALKQQRQHFMALHEEAEARNRKLQEELIELRNEMAIAESRFSLHIKKFHSVYIQRK